MSKKHPLSYPALHPTKRAVNPPKSVPESIVVNAFDIAFGSNVMGGFKKISVHGLLPLVLGVILALTGTKAMQFKSIAVLVCALWLSLTVGMEITEQKWSQHSKIIWFCVSTCLCFCVAMGVMWGFLRATIDVQQDDTNRNLSVRMETAPDPMESVLIFKNNGGPTILKNHSVNCYLNKIVYEGHREVRNFQIVTTQQFASEMKTGEEESDVCLEAFTRYLTGLPLTCLDVTTVVMYSIEPEPQVVNHKTNRWVANKERRFVWFGEPVAASSSYCSN